MEGEHRSRGYDPLDQVGQLSLATTKTEVVLLTQRCQLSPPPSLHLKEEQIRLYTALKYLGLRFDGKLTFKEHAKQTAAKAERVVASISWLMSNLGRSSEGKLASGEHCHVGPPIWGPNLD